MKVIKSHRSVFFDVDDTLVVWDWQGQDVNASDLVEVGDAESGLSKKLLPHKRHINLLKEFKARGHTVVVWSQGGWDWAQSAVKALGLEDHVDFVMSKPDWYVDDIPCQAFMGKNVYMHPFDPSKDNKRFVHENDD